MKTQSILIAGFGGQGVLFAGKFLAYAGLLLQKQLSWLPSYGPEMRGGTANCSVILSDTPVGSPIVTNPDILVAMNLPSFIKYQDSVNPGGIILLDATLIEARPARTDITAYAVPATQMATKEGLGSLANMILMGKLLRECLPELAAVTEEALHKVVPPKKASLIETNQRALALGQAFEG